jgi:undecaprenyl diphosphate synthase|tara:strand:- start:549 stop:1298 length:750 start_codon:yes stop_codon:yes gene_type:complete
MSNTLRNKILSGGDIPKHIAIIMDGNGRWATSHNLPRLAGHREGIKSVREIVRICGEIGIEYLTLYTFSSENWNRPVKEVSSIMKLLFSTIKKEVQNLHKNNVRLFAIGKLDDLPQKSYQEIMEGINKTKENTGLNLILALSYGSRQELLRAVRRIVDRSKIDKIKIDEINEDMISKELYTSEIPDPDLLIRTGGENRISNFLLWQSAYTEFYMVDIFWPEFREKELIKSIEDYQVRQRRFGRTGEQVL